MIFSVPTPYPPFVSLFGRAESIDVTGYPQHLMWSPYLEINMFRIKEISFIGLLSAAESGGLIHERRLPCGHYYNVVISVKYVAFWNRKFSMRVSGSQHGQRRNTAVTINTGSKIV